MIDSALPMICLSLPGVEKLTSSEETIVWRPTEGDDDALIRLHNLGDRLQITVAGGALPGLNYSLPGYPGGSVSTAVWVPFEDCRPTFMAIGDRGSRLDGIWYIDEATIELQITSAGDPLGPPLLLKNGTPATIDQSMTLLRIEVANQVRLGMEPPLAAKATHVLALTQVRAREGNAESAAEVLKEFAALWSDPAYGSSGGLERIPSGDIRRQFASDAGEIHERLTGIPRSCRI